MDTTADRVRRILAANPEVRDLAARALEVEREGRERSGQYYLGWEWHDIPVPVQKLRTLVEEGVVRVNYSSRSTRAYLLNEPEVMQEVLGELEPKKQEQDADGAVPANLFDHIVGHDEVKFWIAKSLASTQPVHILLVGPPATAKSLFLEALGSLPGSQYALGGSSSRAGVADFLLNFRPRYLVVDELEKMRGEDFSVLLSLMSSGVVARLKKRMREVEQMTTWVFAGCNRQDRLPPELLSRFLVFRFHPYTEEEFVDVSVTVITQVLGKDEGLARYVARKLAQRTRDVRQAIQVAKLCDSIQEVDRFEAGVYTS